MVGVSGISFATVKISLIADLEKRPKACMMLKMMQVELDDAYCVGSEKASHHLQIDAHATRNTRTGVQATRRPRQLPASFRMLHIPGSHCAQTHEASPPQTLATAE